MNNRERTLKFYEIYRTKLAPMLGKYETIRKQELEGVVILVSIALSVLIVCAVIIMLTGHSSADNSSQMWLAGIFKLSLLGAVCCFYFSNECCKEFKIKLKTLCLPYLLKLFGAKKAKCSFFDDEIMFAISTNKNLFEIGSLFKSFNDPTSINAFYYELSSIYDMIDYFKLDEKTGL